MEEAVAIAPALSTYGLYAIISVLIYCVIHLYRRTNELEKELKSVLIKFQEERSKYEREIQDKYAEQARVLTETIAKNTDVLDRNTEVMKDIRALFREQSIRTNRTTIA